MQPRKKILVVGDVLADLHLNVIDEKKGRHLIQLGGIFHAARAFNAMQVDYGVAYYAPEYLIGSITDYATRFNSQVIEQLGTIDGAPNVTLITDSTEAGNQGYYDILKDQKVISHKKDLTEIIKSYRPSDMLVFPGSYDLADTINILADAECNLFLDFQYCLHIDNVLERVWKKKVKLHTAIFSTSSEYFLNECSGSLNTLLASLPQEVCHNILLKENRGGARLYSHKDKLWHSSPSFPTQTVHSVGVGDCYNAVLVANTEDLNTDIILRKAALIASAYASTWNYDEFIEIVNYAADLNDDEVLGLKGITIPWEERKNQHIYLAGPDFPHIDTSIIRQIYDSLKYHNFSPHRPILENGLVQDDDSEQVKSMIFANDIDLLDKCQLLIAILIYNDPGTLVELGYFAKSGKPTILFDPDYKAKNIFLKKTPTKICHTLSELIDVTYEVLANER